MELTLEAARQYLIIDENDLITECKRHSALFEEVSSKVIDYVSIMDMLEKVKDTAWTTAYLKSKSSGDKVTDTLAKQHAEIDKDYIVANGKYSEAKTLCSRWTIMKESFIQRGKMLHEMASIHISNSYNNIQITAPKVKPTASELKYELGKEVMNRARIQQSE